MLFRSSMDPGSIGAIVSAVGSLITTSYKAGLGCKSLSEKYKDAPTAIALLEVECQTTQTTLAYIRECLHSHSASLSRRLAGPPNPFSELIHVALTGSAGAFGMLEGQVRTIYASETVTHDYTFQRRVQVIWNERSLTDLLERMKNVKSTLSLLLNVIQT